MGKALITLPDMVTNYSPVFGLGDVVTLKINGLRIDNDAAGMVTGYLVRPQGISYLVTWGAGNEATHYDLELETFGG